MTLISFAAPACYGVLPVGVDSEAMPLLRSKSKQLAHDAAHLKYKYALLQTLLIVITARSVSSPPLFVVATGVHALSLPPTPPARPRVPLLVCVRRAHTPR